MIFHTLPISILPFILIFTRLSTSLANETELYANCRNPFQCANIQNISYPFWGGDRLRSCGHPSFELNCETEGYPQITIQSSKYRVLSIDSTKSSITVVRSEFWDSFCPSTPSNATLDTPYLTFSSISENITLYYGCLLQNPLFPNHFDCQPGEGNTTSYYRTQYHGSNIFNLIFESCYTNVLVQVNHTSAKALSSNPPSIDISIALRSGFELVWDVNNDECSRCVQSDGVCGSNPNSESSSFSCFCSDRAYEVSCNNSGSGIGELPLYFVTVVLARTPIFTWPEGYFFLVRAILNEYECEDRSLGFIIHGLGFPIWRRFLDLSMQTCMTNSK